MEHTTFLDVDAAGLDYCPLLGCGWARLRFDLLGRRCSVFLLLFIQVRCTIPVVGRSFYGTSSHKYRINQIPHHIFKGGIRLELLHTWRLDAPLSKDVWIMHQAVNDQYVNGHH